MDLFGSGLETVAADGLRRKIGGTKTEHRDGLGERWTGNKSSRQHHTDCGYSSQVVIDGKGHLLGRLASIVAKQLLSGQKIVIVRCEALNISGEFFRSKRTFTPDPPTNSIITRTSNTGSYCCVAMFPKTRTRRNPVLTFECSQVPRLPAQDDTIQPHTRR